MNTNAKLAKTRRHHTIRSVVSMRTKKLMSWAEIGEMLGIAPRTARRLFQEAKGLHQHHDHLPGKGGRFPAGQYNAKEEVTTVWLLAEDEATPVLDGSGNVNKWVAVTL